MITLIVIVGAVLLVVNLFVIAAVFRIATNSAVIADNTAIISNEYLKMILGELRKRPLN